MTEANEYGRGFPQAVEAIIQIRMMQHQTGEQIFYGDDLRRSLRKAGVPLSVELPDDPEYAHFDFENEEPSLEDELIATMPDEEDEDDA